jgi:ribonuclease HI
MTLRAFTDGASRGNPGDAGIGVIVRDEAGKTVLTLKGYIGKTTNNIAEYTALLTLLHRMKDLTCSRLIVHSDSELMVRQLSGKYKVKNGDLKVCHARVAALIGQLPFTVEVKHVPRELNKEADALANEGIESKAILPG